jgi:hypothetical protein
MKAAGSSSLLLRLYLVLRQAGALPLAAGALLVAAAAAAGWLRHTDAQLARQRLALRTRADIPRTAPASAPAPDDSNLALFYRTLGDQRYAEQQVRTLFGLAEKTGLTLSRGTYRSMRDEQARLIRYQIDLPVKGSYASIWRFSLLALRAIPFASLDDISFKRETAGDPGVEAHLRFTLYLGGNAP